MEEDGDVTPGMILLLCLSGIAALIGLGIFACGVWSVADDSTMLYWINDLADKELFRETQMSYLVCPFGVYAVIPFVLAAIGIIKRMPGFIVAFLVVTSVGVLVGFPLCVIPLVQWDTTTLTKIKTIMTDSLNENYLGTPYSWTEESSVSVKWEKMFINNECCGVNGIADFDPNAPTYGTLWRAKNAPGSYVLSDTTSHTKLIPVACCEMRTKTLATNDDWQNFHSYMLSEMCPVNKLDALTRGCYGVITGPIREFIFATMGTMMAMIGLQMLSVLAGCFVLFPPGGGSGGGDGSKEAETGFGHPKNSQVAPYPNQQQGPRFGAYANQNGGYDGRPPPYGDDGYGANGTYNGFGGYNNY